MTLEINVESREELQSRLRKQIEIYKAAQENERELLLERLQNALKIFYDANPLLDFSCGCNKIYFAPSKIHGHIFTCFYAKLDKMPPSKRAEFLSLRELPLTLNKNQ